MSSKKVTCYSKDALNISLLFHDREIKNVSLYMDLSSIKHKIKELLTILDNAPEIHRNFRVSAYFNQELSSFLVSLTMDLGSRDIVTIDIDNIFKVSMYTSDLREALK